MNEHAKVMRWQQWYLKISSDVAAGVLQYYILILRSQKTLANSPKYHNVLWKFSSSRQSEGNLRTSWDRWIGFETVELRGSYTKQNYDWRFYLKVTQQVRPFQITIRAYEDIERTKVHSIRFYEEDFSCCDVDCNATFSCFSVVFRCLPGGSKCTLVFINLQTHLKYIISLPL